MQCLLRPQSAHKKLQITLKWNFIQLKSFLMDHTKFSFSIFFILSFCYGLVLEHTQWSKHRTTFLFIIIHSTKISLPIHAANFLLLSAIHLISLVTIDLLLVLFNSLFTSYAILSSNPLRRVVPPARTIFL